MGRKITAIPPKKELVTERKRVAAYARVSSGKDAMIHSLSAQISYYSNFIQSHGDWKFSGVYADEAITGTKDNRAEFQRMIADCKTGKIDMIITKSISRFARNTVTLLETVRELKTLGVDVYFEEQNIHSMSGDGELMLTILASFAQEESLSVSENCKWRIRNDYKRGIVPMNLNRLYGMRRRTDGGFEFVLEEVAVIKYIYNLYLAGFGAERIAKMLNEEGIPAPMQKSWHKSRVMYILSNEKYIGDVLLQKSFVENHITKRQVLNKGQLPQYYLEEHHEGFIDRDVFERVQKELAIRREKNKPKESKKTYPFSSMIRCELCGMNYSRKISHCANKYRRVFWNCATNLRKGKAFCHTKQIPEEELYKLSCEVLGITEFDEALFKAEIKEITVPDWNVVTFVFYDGKEITKTWKDKSRKWTDEMKLENYENLRRGHKS